VSVCESEAMAYATGLASSARRRATLASGVRWVSIASTASSRAAAGAESSAATAWAADACERAISARSFARLRWRSATRPSDTETTSARETLARMTRCRLVDVRRLAST